MSEPTSDTAADAPPTDLETKNLPGGYGHAGVPIPDQLGYQAPTSDATASAIAETEPATPDAATEQQDGSGTADAGAAPNADAGATTPEATTPSA